MRVFAGTGGDVVINKEFFRICSARVTRAAPLDGGATLSGSKQRYEQEAARLAKLPRAQRFEELIDFPTRHVFKVIGEREGLGGRLQDALAELGYVDVVPVERASAKGRWLALTFVLEVHSSERLDAIYSRLEVIPGLAYLF